MEAQAAERKMVPVRLRCLNFLRKWRKIHPSDFAADERMKKLLFDFLACARVTGNDKFVDEIEKDDSSSNNSNSSNKAVASFIPKVGVRTILSLSDVSPEGFSV